MKNDQLTCVREEAGPEASHEGFKDSFSPEKTVKNGIKL